MAKVTCKRLTYAKYTSGGNDSAIVYSGGTALTDYLAKADITIDTTDESEYADGHLIDSERMPIAVNAIFEMANMNDDIKTDILGWISNGTGANAEMQLSEADAPFVGIGCLMANRFKGTVTYEGYWIYKAQFVADGFSAETRRDRTAWQHETMSGKGLGVTLSASTPTVYFAHKSGMTESAAITWLNGHAGVTAVSG